MKDFQDIEIQFYYSFRILSTDEKNYNHGTSI